MKKQMLALMTASMLAAGTLGAAITVEAETTVKAGFIVVHDENSTYDLNFINAAKEACENEFLFLR